MRTKTFLCFALVLTASLPVFAQQSPSAGTLQVIRAFRRIAAQDLWPGFQPATTPVEFFGGTNTYLLNQPSPPDGFHPVAGQQNVYVYPGQHETVRANTGTVVNGVPTATADISGNASPAGEQAALLVQETFHVFQAKRYPKWGGDEMDLFTYPVDNAEVLAQRRLESIGLVRAMDATEPKEVNCWAAAAMAVRSRRFAALPATAAAYERGIELREGLAQCVQFKSFGKQAPLTAEDFPPDQTSVRQRAYASGQALALLLDRVDSAWKSRLGGDPPVSLDELLAARLGEMTVRAGCDFTAEETHTAQAQAQRDIADFTGGLGNRKRDFLAAAGVRLEIVAGKEPLWPQGFDPWNVVILGNKEILHTRWQRQRSSRGSRALCVHRSCGRPSPFQRCAAIDCHYLADPKVSQGRRQSHVRSQRCHGYFRRISRARI